MSFDFPSDQVKVLKNFKQFQNDLHSKSFFGQKTTSRSKPLVYVLKNGLVYKGPYVWEKKHETLRRLFFRQRLFADIFESQVQGPFTIVRFEQGNNSKETFVYLEMPNIVSTISSISSDDWKFTVEPVLGFDEPQKVVKKSSQKIEELIDYVERQTQDIQEHVIYDSLKHFINRAVCVPVVGDPALRNILIDISQSTHRAVNIDFEDNRTVQTVEKIEKKRKQNDVQSSEESTVSIFFKLLIGNKLWGAKKIEFFVKMMLKNPAIIRQHFDFIKQKLTINESREMIESFAKTYKFTECDVDQMTRRCQEITKAFNDLIEQQQQQQQKESNKKRKENDDD